MKNQLNKKFGRSNRQSNMFSLKMLKEYLANGDVPDCYEKDVSVHVEWKDDGTKVFQIIDFGQPIFELAETSLTINAGARFDDQGRPFNCTMERLNGLLDAAGVYELIPEGVRMFFAKEDKHSPCNIGSKVPVEKYVPCWQESRKVVIDRDPNVLVFLEPVA